MMLQGGWGPIEQSERRASPADITQQWVVLAQGGVVPTEVPEIYLAWNALLVPRWSKSWHKQPTIRARISASARTSWKLGVCRNQRQMSFCAVLCCFSLINIVVYWYGMATLNVVLFCFSFFRAMFNWLQQTDNLFRVYPAFSQQVLGWLQQPHKPERDLAGSKNGWMNGWISK